MYYLFGTPYKLRDVFRLLTPNKSNLPLIAANFIPIRSFTLTPLSKTVECCCKLLKPSPGILTLVDLSRLVIFTLAILLFAEFGFLGDTVVTAKIIAFFWGFLLRIPCFLSKVRQLESIFWDKRDIIKSSVPNRIRTYNHLINSQTLYQLKLLKQHYSYQIAFLIPVISPCTKTLRNACLEKGIFEYDTLELPVSKHLFFALDNHFV